jgi:Pectate lyase superfamily protein
MYLKKISVRIVVLVISIPLVVLGTIVSVVGQAPPNLPPPGAYVPIPNFTGVGAGSLFRKAINDRFSGAQRMAPAIATTSFANLPAELDGTLIYCADCKLTSPCAGSGTGAWALGARGQWSCASGALEANLNANGNKMTNLANGTVGGDTLAFGQPAGSDLSGSLPNPIVQTVLGGKTPVYANQSNPMLADSTLGVVGGSTKVIVQGSANFTLNKPSTVVSGHTMIVGYFSNDTAAPTPPSGWTLIRSDTACGIFGTMGSYYKVAGSSEPGTYTWTINGGNNYHSAALIDVGVTATNPVDVISPAVCAAGPTLAGLTLGAQPEKVVIFGGGSNNYLGSATEVAFNQGTQFAQVQGSGSVPFSGAYLTANYAISPSVTMTTGGGAAQMIAIKPASTYSSSPVLQGDGFAEVTNLVGTTGRNSSIKGFNIDGRFNVKNPIYGAKGDGLTDDTAAIQAAYNATCAAAIGANSANANIGATLWFPAGTYITSFSLISNCSQPITWKCESEGACTIQAVSEGIFPIIMHEAASYLNGITTQAPILAASLATGSGSSLNWGPGSAQYYDLKDAQLGLNATGWNNAKPINGQSALTVEGFLNYAGGPPGNAFILESSGDDLNLANNASTAIQLYLVSGTPNTISACITTTGSGFVCTGAGGSITAGTTYEFEASYDGSTLRTFVGTPGSTTTLAGSVAATGTIVQKPSEVFALGDGGGLTIGGTNFASAHWIGQLDSIRVSNVARHTATYTAPTAKFSNDGNTLILLNNHAQNDTLLQVSNIAGAPLPAWIPLHYYGPFGIGLTPGNVHANFVNLSLQGGNYNLLGENVLYTTLDHVTGTGASHDSFKFEYISYGTRVEHLTVSPAAFGEANVVFCHTNGEIDLSWLFSTGGYYGMELIDSGGTYSMLFMNPSSTTLADLDIGGSTIFTSISIHEFNVDFESGGTPIPARIWGQGAFEFYGGDWQYDPSVNAIWASPATANAGLALSLFGGQVDILGTPTNPLISWKGSGSPATPATWINPIINGKALSAATVPLSDNSDYAQALGDVLIPPVKTVATLPTCNSAAKGWVVQIKDCNTNCTTYLGTSFTGGGSTRSTVQCNGTAWELH